MSALPLDGVRVLDFSMVWAGPFATKLLADMGATVIKIESPARMDPIRMATIEIFMLEAPDMTTQPYNRSAYFNEYNRNKKSLVIDTIDPHGRAVIEKLITASDIIVENFRPGVLARLGYGDDVVFGLNPKITRVSMPAYSSYGSEARQVGYGPNIEEMAGITRLNGYPDGPPMKTGISFGDPMAGTMAAAGSMLGLLRRARTSNGAKVEVSQRNAVIGFAGEAVMQWAMNHTEPDRLGNRSDRYAPQGCYPCAPGADRRLDVYHSAGQGSAVSERWITISIRSDAEWDRLCAAMDRADLAADERYATTDGRRAEHDTLDAEIAAWTSTVQDTQVLEALQAQGIPAGRVLSCTDVAADRHLLARGFLEDVHHPVAGDQKVTTPAWRLRREQATVREPAPTFGEDNVTIVTELGLSTTEIDELAEAGVIATAPRF